MEKSVNTYDYLKSNKFNISISSTIRFKSNPYFGSSHDVVIRFVVNHKTKHKIKLITGNHYSYHYIIEQIKYIVSKKDALEISFSVIKDIIIDVDDIDYLEIDSTQMI